MKYETLLNLISLALGLIAWILPLAAIVGRNRIGREKRALLSCASLAACAVSLCLWVFYQRHLAKIEDWSAIADTSRAVTIASSTLLAITVALNAAALFSRRAKS